MSATTNHLRTYLRILDVRTDLQPGSQTTAVLPQMAHTQAAANANAQTSGFRGGLRPGVLSVEGSFARKILQSCDGRDAFDTLDGASVDDLVAIRERLA